MGTLSEIIRHERVHKAENENVVWITYTRNERDSTAVKLTYYERVTFGDITLMARPPNRDGHRSVVISMVGYRDPRVLMENDCDDELEDAFARHEFSIELMENEEEAQQAVRDFHENYWGYEDEDSNDEDFDDFISYYGYPYEYDY